MERGRPAIFEVGCGTFKTGLTAPEHGKRRAVKSDRALIDFVRLPSVRASLVGRQHPRAEKIIFHVLKMPF
ncbi:MAG: hypothetical protein CMF26_04380 [Kiloniella sp.]|nr:hypothetical protein [Kiloniella sp.]